MTQKQLVNANNAELNNVKAEVAKLPMADDVKNGKWVWKKYSIVSGTESLPYPTISFKQDVSGTVVAGSSFTINGTNLSKFHSMINSSFLNGYKYTDSYGTMSVKSEGSNVRITGTGDFASHNGLYRIEVDTYVKLVYIEGTYPTYGGIDMGNFTKSGTVQVPTGQPGKGDFIAYTVSDSETAYPDGGEKDGFWWERVKELGSNLNYGIVTPTRDISEISVEHKLGKTPKGWVIMNTQGAADRDGVASGMISYPGIYRTLDAIGYVFYSTSSATVDLTGAANENTVTFKSKRSQFEMNRTYLWVVFA